MITRKDIIQGTPEWMAVRWAKVGGTRSKGLFTKGDTLYLEMLAEYTEQYVHEESYQSAAMERGNELEPEAIFEMMQYTGVNVQSVGWLQSVECPILGISPDAITEDETICFEVKCPSAKKHVENCLSADIPLDYVHQCVHYFTVNPKLSTLYFGSYRPEALKPLKVWSINRNKMINLGTFAKPVLKSVQEWSEIALKEAHELNKQMNKGVELLSF
jgi:hypothetical protein